jgi:hypothetical protein
VTGFIGWTQFKLVSEWAETESTEIVAMGWSSDTYIHSRTHAHVSTVVIPTVGDDCNR